MSDDSNSHYRSSDPYGRAPAQANDPLAELARLIGQNDPFSEFGRESRPPAPQDTHYAEPAPASEVAYDHAPPNDWQNAPPAAPAYDPYEHQAPVAPEPHYEAASHGDTHVQPVAEPYQPGPVPYGAPQSSYDTSAYDQAAPGGQHFQHAPFAAPSFQQPAYPHDDSQTTPSDEYYDDAPPEGRRKGLITVVAVLGLAVIGTAGAFGYRSVFGSSSPTTSTPPVIRANSEPSKVAPPPQQASNDSSAAKLTYDRFADRSQNEQIKVREEPPLDIKELAARAAAPQSSAPAISNVATTNTTTPVAGSSATAANPPSVLTEPKRVRTLQIHPDQQEAVSPRQPLPQPVNAMPAAPAPRQSGVAAAAAANAPTSLAPDAAAPKAAAPHVVRTAAVPRAQAPEPPPANAPLSLSPDGNSSLPAAPQLASTRSTPPRVASVAPAAAVSANGHYLVQVSSQRSEADAQTSYRGIQAKYGSVLGDRQPVIRKADLGAKGTYYRAMVGPFASRADAISLCGNLKAAGGDCVVQGN